MFEEEPSAYSPDWIDASVASPSPGRRAESSLPDAGCVLIAAMKRVGERQNELQAAEASRIVALLDAYGATMEDAEAAGEPTGRHRFVAKGFLMAAGHVLRVSQRGAAHLLDTASAVRSSLPHSWAVFVAGECGWRLLDITHRQAAPRIC